MKSLPEATSCHVKEESTGKASDKPTMKEVAVDEDTTDKADPKDFPLERQAFSKEIAED